MSDADVAAGVVIEFDSHGLVPVIAQDATTGAVLMFAYADRTAIERTDETGMAHYYSRSREELWQKGATSGHVQHVEQIRIDCDGDAVLYRVRQEGGACHTGYESCFYRAVEGVSNAGAPTEQLTAETRVVDERVFDPETVYGE
jgi:phosphoribosyl-AMP cyclohydrolase